MKHLITLILLKSIAFVSNAQERFNPYPDSIKVDLPDQQSVIIFEFREYKNDKRYISEFPAYLKEILTYVQKGLPEDFETSGPYMIDVRIIEEGQELTLSVGTSMYTKPTGEKILITIKQMIQPETKLTVRNKEIVELLPPGWQMTITSKKLRVSIYSQSLKNLSGISSADLNLVNDTVNKEADLKTLWRKTIKSRVVMQDNRIIQSGTERVVTTDNIFITGIGGVGIVRDQIYPELTAKFGLTLNDRFGRHNFRPSLIYNHMFFAQKTTDGYQMNMNGFLSASFEVNFNKKSKPANWAGIGVGFLTRQSGDYFTGNTMKFFITHESENKRISIVPEFYLTDDLKKFTFGTTLRYTF